MEQHDGAGMDARQQLVVCLLGGWLIVGQPVYIGEAPEKGGITQFLCHGKVLCTVFPLGRSVETAHFGSGDAAVEAFHIGELLFEAFHRGNLGHIRVMVGMVSDDVPFIRHAPYEIRAAFQKMPYHKECACGVMFVQGIQDRFCISIFKAAVKGEVDDLFFRVVHIGSPVLSQLFRGGVPHGSSAFLLKA